MWHTVSGETPWQQIITSPLLRCREFASSLSEKLQIPLDQDERLKEVGFGAWEGKTSAELEASAPGILNRFYHDPIVHRPSGAEQLERFSARVNQALDQTVRAHPGKHILIVCHAGVIRAVLTRVMSAPLVSMYRCSVASASVSRILFEQDRPPTILLHGVKKL